MKGHHPVSRYTASLGPIGICNHRHIFAWAAMACGLKTLRQARAEGLRWAQPREDLSDNERITVTKHTHIGRSS